MTVLSSLPLALAVLAVGPVLGNRLSRWPQALSLLDGFVLAAVFGLVSIEILPGMLSTGGVLLPALAVLGFALPSLVERFFVASGHRAHRAVLALAVGGLALHSILDGVALAEGARTQGSLLGLGVILHQLPVGLMVWAVLRERPAPTFWLVLGMMGTMTVAGSLTGDHLLGTIGHAGASALDAIIGGSLLHVVTHRGPHRHSDGSGASPAWESGGALAGLVFLFVVIGATRESLGTLTSPATVAYLQRLVALAGDSAPALLLAYAVSGLIAVWAPASSIAWLRRGGALQQATRGMVLGLPLPICSCGVVPLYQSLIRRGAPPTAALALLVAAPELGADAFLMSLPLLGLEFTLMRVISAALVALSVALVIGQRLPSRLPTLVPEFDARESSLWSRLRRAGRAGFGDMLDHTAPWILVGLLVAAAITPAVMSGLSITRLPPLVDVVVFAAIGIPTFVCASAATPLVAVLVAGGVSPGAGLAFLLSGPATNLSTIGVLSRLHGRSVGLLFAAAVGLGSVLAGVVTNLLLPGWKPVAPGVQGNEPLSALALVALFALGVLTCWSLTRRGPRAFFGELALSVTSERHAHDHAAQAHHGHAHSPTTAQGPTPDHRHDITPASPSPASSR